MFRKLSLLLLVLSPVLMTTAHSNAGNISFAETIGRTLPNAIPWTFGSSAAICIGNKVIDTLGVERLAELGVKPDTVQEVFGKPPFNSDGFSAQEIESLLDAIEACVPFIDIIEVAVISAENADDWLDTEQIQAAFTECLRSAISTELARQLWRDLFSQPRTVFLDTFNQTSNLSTGCFEAIFCGQATLLGSLNIPVTVQPGGSSVLFDYGGAGGLTFFYTLPILGLNTCPFTQRPSPFINLDQFE